MPDLSITAASVLASTSATKAEGVAGATITAGQSLYIDTADSNKLKLYDADGSSPVNVFAGIALHGAATGQPIKYATKDPSFTPGFAALAGDSIYGSDTPGGVTKTFSELETADVVTSLGVMTSTTVMNLNPVRGGAIAA
jgi:hypothetical protein